MTRTTSFFSALLGGLACWASLSPARAQQAPARNEAEIAPINRAISAPSPAKSSSDVRPDASPVHYPPSRRSDQTDTYFGTVVPDPYRWLEDLDSPETKVWVQAQNKLTFGYLEGIPYRDQLRARLTQLWNYERYGVPEQAGELLIYSKNNGLQNQAVLYAKRADQAGDGQVLLDPNLLSKDGTTALAGTSVSNDHHYLAYTTSGGGSDWQQVRVLDLRTGKSLPDVLDWVKVSGTAWYKDGFFYSRYDAPKDGANRLSGKNEFHKVYYHQLGTQQSADKLVYENPKMALGFRIADVTEDERFLIVSLTDGKSDGNRLLVRDLQNPAQREQFVTLIDSYDHDNSVVGTVGGELLVYTNYKAPNFRLVRIDPRKPQEGNWHEVLPAAADKLEGVSQVGGRLMASYLHNASSQVKVYSEQGQLQHELQLPAIGTVSGLQGRRTDQAVYYAFTSFTYPTTIYRYDLATNTSTVFRAPKVDVSPDLYETRQVFYPSADGTKVPLFIVFKKGLKLDGQNPTYLYGYGGFNVSLTPGFSVGRLLWLENGGVLAVANLRGGGEFGEAWHKAGMTPHKQTVFDDFAAAAAYLKEFRYTSTEKLAIAGGSNGGLLVGAALTQHPDLCRVALPAVGVMDMLRYQKFTIGWNWAPEYGTSDNKAQFENLLRFSPLHNLKPGTQYPATLITTADHDDRVVPAHSFKFAAALQAAQAGPRPTLIRVDVNAGHGAGKSTQLQIQEWADIWAFTYWNLGVKPFPGAKF